MWTIWLSVALMAVAGIVLTDDQVSGPVSISTRKAADLSESMALYRDAVVTYVSNNPGFTGTTVPDQLLVFPSWYVPPSPSVWSNYVAPVPARTIVIYASRVPANDILSDIVRLSENSILVGKAVNNMLYAPGDDTGKPGIALPMLGGVAVIPNGSPVWIAMPN